MTATTLKDRYAGKFLVGCVMDKNPSSDYSPEEQRLAAAHFNALTSENQMKPSLIQPEEGRFEFANPDACVAFAERHGMTLVGHTLCWHSQVGDWMFAGRDRATTLRRLQRHIDTVVKRYRGKVKGWDVVNEAISDNSQEYIRPSAWTEVVGPDYVVQAFRYAHEADADTELYYNDYSIELPYKRDRTLRLLDEIRQSGTRLDAVGIQGHWESGKVPFEEIDKAIGIFAAEGLKVMITELDIDVLPRDFSGADASKRAEPTSKPRHPADNLVCPPEVLRQQAEEYGRLFDLFESHAAHITRVSLWGLHDGRSWLNIWPTTRTNHGLLFDRQLQPKPAFHAAVG